MLDYVAQLSGLVATLWITFGVYVAAKFYPNYDHINQFCSELGATGSPTQKLSPRINNYPLSILFCLFGWAILTIEPSNLAFISAGTLIILHGIGTGIAGYFPMDRDPYTVTPSLNCKIHSWAGMVMFVSLLIAPIILAFSPESEQIPFWFRLFSVATVVVSIFFLVKMAKGFKQRSQAGLYQRLSYWVKLLWLSVFSVLLALA